MATLQVGSLGRFKSQGSQKEPHTPDVSNVQLENPPNPVAYRGLQSGPGFSLEYEPNQTPAVDGTQSLLRSLSPFMIQVEPPLAYASQTEKGKTDLAGILASGHRSAPSAFRAARKALDEPGLEGSMTSGAKSVEQFVSNGVLHKPQGAESTQAVDLHGDGASRIGSPAIADLYSAVDVTMQLRALVNTPPLVLLINPQSLVMAYNKVQQYTDRSRYGFVFQAWGEEQPKLSIEARCGAFVSGGRGVQWASRRDSASWQNLATAFQFYRHNGYIYDTIGKSNAHHFVGALSIHYDGWVYYGNMESFNYALDESQQNGGITFSMEFTVNAMVDTSKTSPVILPMTSPVPSPSDPRYGGIRRQASVGPGDTSVSLPNPPSGGGPILNLRPSQDEGLSSDRPTAPPGTRGFVAPTETSVTTSPASSTRRYRPFGLGG